MFQQMSKQEILQHSPVEAFKTNPFAKSNRYIHVNLSTNTFPLLYYVSHDLVIALLAATNKIGPANDPNFLRVWWKVEKEYYLP